MAHRHYCEVKARSPADCGRELGLMFGAIVRRYISEARTAKTWEHHKRQAKLLMDITGQYFPAYISELRAYAEAAEVPLLDLWTMSIEDELGGESFERCTTVVTNGGHLIGHNEDWDEDSAEDICILKRTCGSTTTLQLYYYACPLGGTALTVSSGGYIQAVNSLPNERRQSGVPKIVLARRLSELGDLTKEIGGLLAIPRSSGFAHTLVDRKGCLTLIEATAGSHHVQQPRTPFVHTNHIIGHTSEDDATGDGSTFLRYEAACRQVSPAMERSSLDRLLSDASGGEGFSILNRNTIARGIVDLKLRAAWLWLRRESKLGWVRYDLDFLSE